LIKESKPIFFSADSIDEICKEILADQSGRSGIKTSSTAFKVSKPVHFGFL
jgi:hypothetical protein